MTCQKINRFLFATMLLAAPALAGRHALADDELTYTCYAKYTCYNGGIITTYRLPGTGNTQNAARAAAQSNANAARQTCLSLGHQTTPVVDDGCDPPSALLPADQQARPVAATTGSVNILVLHSCLTRNGHQVIQVLYGPRENLEVLSDLASDRMAADAANDGGMVPGSGRSRVEDMFFYLVYQTVRSTNATTKVHRELTVEGRGATDADAQAAAAQATKKVISHLSTLGETAQALGTPRPRTVVRTDYELLTEYCVYQCKTAGGWTVIATDYGTNKPEACGAARGAAYAISTNYGSATSGAEIDPKDEP